MKHVRHIQKNKKHLELRSEIIRLVREFFWSKNFIEVETPLLIRLPGQEPYLSPMKLSLHDETKTEYTGYLHTSPEYTMKKMITAGFENIFSICKCFRDYESFGGYHNPEFTMLEWYRKDKDMFAIMNDVESLLKYIQTKLSKSNIQHSIFNIQVPSRIHMRDLWKKYVDVNLDEYLTTKKILRLCREKKYNPKDDEPYEDLFYRIFLNEIEPKITEPTIVHHYPAQMAALAKLSDEDPKYAERFEVYINRFELANAFTELTDADEQLKRLRDEQEQRKNLGKDVYDIDMEFVVAVKNMPESAGIALGIDRLIQIFAGCKNIDGVLTLPASLLFNE